jgi:DNA-binding transcriptional ArsR family regulator
MKAPESACCEPFLKALGDRTRWRIVGELLSDAITVSELAKRLKVSQYNTSKHLRIRREAGIVEAVKRGKHVHCRIAPAFQRRMANNKNQLDLGCCVFRFDKTLR